MTHQANVRRGSTPASSIGNALRAISVGSFLFQLGVTQRLKLHPTDLHAIYVLGRAPDGLTAGELGTSVGLTTGSVTALVDRLVARDFLVRTPDEADGRRVVVRLTETAGSKLADEYRDIDERVLQAIAALSDAERAVVARFLDTIVTRE